jgi:hypothetical protein
MSDWQVGDLAVCVDDSPTLRPHCPLIVGRTYRVVGISILREGLIVAEAVAMNQSFGGGFLMRRFRKVRPDEREACEPEFVTLLKRSKQRVSA